MQFALLCAFEFIYICKELQSKDLYKDCYDVVIVGSGLAGLVSAYILSKNGYKVVVLEKNHQVGGCLQSFSRHGVSFDTGVHYVGAVEEGGILRRFFRYLGLDRIPLQFLDEDAYDTVTIEGKSYAYAHGYEGFADTLSRQFPSQRAQLHAYVDGIRQVAEHSPLYDFRLAESPDFIYSEAMHLSADAYIASRVSDARLAEVLAGTRMLYAGVKGRSPFYLHALINHSYMLGAARPVGGSQQIADSLVDSIRAFGGEVYTDSEVTSLQCGEAGVTAVIVADGRRFDAGHVISDIHPVETLRLTQTPLIRKAYRDRVCALENTISNFALYIRFKEGRQPYLNTNHYVYPQGGVWENRNGEESHYLYMHQCHTSHPEYAQSAVVISPMPYEEVSPWEQTVSGHRGAAYQEFKEEKKELLLRALERSFPGTLQNILYCDAATPLTYRDFTATYKGSTYGVLKDCTAIAQTVISHRTKVPNLYLTGQSVSAHGVLGVIAGAMVNASAFLGKEFLARQIYEN